MLRCPGIQVHSNKSIYTHLNIMYKTCVCSRPLYQMLLLKGGRSRVICLRFAFGISWVFIRCRTGEGLWVTAWNYQQSIHLASANVANKECRRVTYQIKAEYINILILTMDHMRMCNVNSWWDSWWWTRRELSPDCSSPQFSSDLASSGSQF